MVAAQVTRTRPGIAASRRGVWRLWLLTAAMIVLVGCGRSGSTEGGSTQTLTMGGRTFRLELALDDAARFQGLSDRAQIPADGGMLFVFPRAQELAFVMRRCLVPIDIIFLDPTGRVVQTHAMAVEPYDTPEHALKRYASLYPAQFVIELQGGMLAQLDLRSGQKIDLPVERLKGMAR